MMSPQDKCPLCWNKYGGVSRMTGSSGDASQGVTYFECELCGQFGVPTEAIREMGMLDRSMERMNNNIPLARTRLIQFDMGIVETSLLHEDLRFEQHHHRKVLPEAQAL